MFLTFLENIGCGGVLIDTAGLTIDLNATAHRILQESSGSRFPIEDRTQIRQSLERLLGCDVRRLREERLVVPTNGERWPIIAAVMRPRVTSTNEKNTKKSDISDKNKIIAVVLLDLNVQSPLDAGMLQKAFGLTTAESNLAMGIAQGATLNEIARSQGVSMHTVRGHLASAFAKTHTRRQAELSALLARLSLISP